MRNKPFNEKVWEKCKQIPKGKVSTYLEIAKATGKPKASRAIGNALNKNPWIGDNRNLGSHVPCHRVIYSNGKIGGFAKEIKEKEKMLRKEGVEVINGKIDLKKFGFEFD